jgi:translation initiation factor IF-2
MAQVTVHQLAEVVGATADRLLTQMKEAGLPHTAAEEAVSDEDKQTLLTHLKRSHGESTKAPRRITLKRKTSSTLRTAGSQGRKTVNVEVRKKRTYVKRDPAELVAEAAAAVAAEAEGVVVDGTATTQVDEAVVAAEAAPEVVEAAVEAVVASEEFVEVIEPEVIDEDPANMDPEVLRQRAAARRKAQEAEETAARQAAVTARKMEAERQKAQAERCWPWQKTRP